MKLEVFIEVILMGIILKHSSIELLKTEFVTLANVK